MAREGMLQELDHSKLPVIKELDPDWLNNLMTKAIKYSLPQLLGAPGIAFNTNTYKGSDFTSWGDSGNLNMQTKSNYWMMRVKYSILRY